MSDRDEPQSALFDLRPAWTEHWVGMPEYVHEDLMPWRSVQVHFESEEDLQLFAERVGQKLTDKTKSFWYPEDESERPANTRYADADVELEQGEPRDSFEAVWNNEEDAIYDTLEPDTPVERSEPTEPTEPGRPRDLFDLL